MANYFSTAVWDVLAGGELPGFNFIDIFLDGPQTPSNQSDTYFFADIHLCDWIRNITNPNTSILYQPELLKGVESPPKTGNVSQEIQRIAIAQALGLWDDPAEFIVRMGNKFHGARIVVSTYIEIDDAIEWDEPINTSEGIVKGISRNLSSQDVVVEFTNTYGKLDMIKSLRTNQGSIQRLNKGDTSFDKASVDIGQRTIEWGVK